MLVGRWWGSVRALARATLVILGGVFSLLLALILVKLVVLPALGLRGGHAPTQVVVDDPLEFLGNVGLTTVTIVTTYGLYMWGVARRPPTELRVRPGFALVGLVSGPALIGLPMSLLYLMGFYRLDAVTGFEFGMLGVVGVVLMMGVLEELIFRGLVFGVLERKLGVGPAGGISSVAFCLAHFANENWEGIMPSLSLLLLGLFWAGLYLILARNIWALVLHHAAWNLTIFISGLPLSGIQTWRVFAPLQSSFHGSMIMTGGPAGPEASIVTVVVLVTACVALWPTVRRHSNGLRPSGQ